MVMIHDILIISKLLFEDIKIVTTIYESDFIKLMQDYEKYLLETKEEDFCNNRDFKSFLKDVYN